LFPDLEHRIAAEKVGTISPASSFAHMSPSAEECLMKRILLAFVTLGMLTAGSFAILSAGPMGTAKAAVLSRQAAQRGPYAAANGPAANEPAARAPGSSTPYGASGPAYMPGQTKSTDFQLQH
jgi:hypothetical protein